METRLKQKELCACYLFIEMKCTLVRLPAYIKYDFSKFTDSGNSIEIFPL